ncbi:hypothetical protein O9H85_14920 [Paenibacillus filicis]|uniref:Uncharacterized protein n=1 Tax=Paenibacillus gyeongsangnamensis TaxID=3388067 RepID=A0ABT4Q9Z4_9BACL|nr:hypothetical protein [Paenibacillus filicis]MCZ8513702.1 hypothetical protein [Paenibacillus filicis]
MEFRLKSDMLNRTKDESSYHQPVHGKSPRCLANWGLCIVQGIASAGAADRSYCDVPGY